MTSPQKDCSQKSTTSTHLPDTPLNLSKCYTTEKTTEAQPTPITTDCKQANTTSPNTHHCNTDDSYDLYDDRPESPIPWQDLVGDYGSDSDSQDELYTPETEESSEDEEAVIAEADPHGSEFEEQIDEEIERGAEGSEGDTTDEEFQVVKDRVKGLNSRLFEIATDLQKEAAEGRLHSQRKAQSNNVVSEGSKEDNAVLSEYEDSGEDCNTPEGSDDEGVGALIRRDRKKVATDKVDFSTFQWEAGQRFPSRQDFRAAVTRFAVTQGKDLYFCVSSSKRNQRLGVKCKSGCPFKLYASWDNNSAAFIVKSINPEHTCHRTMENNRQLKSTWLADQFLEVFKARPHWPASEIIETVRRAYRGILNACAKVLPRAEHRHCARHIFAHWHKKNKGDEMKILFWKTVWAYNEADFQDSLAEMEKASPSAVDDFKAHNPNVFCRAFLDTTTKCDVVTSNMAETFNGYIIQARTKHLIYMLEDIRCALMQRLVVKRLEMEKSNVKVCPRIQAKLEKHKEEAAECYVQVDLEGTEEKIPMKTLKKRGKEVQPAPKRPRGRPKKDGSNPTPTSQPQSDVTAEPSRTGRGGRVIRGGRGSRGGGRGGGRGNGGGRGAASGGRTGGGSRTARRIPQGFGVFISTDGTPISNMPGQQGGPRVLTGEALLSSQASNSNTLN
ncbi:Antiviral helicase SKI2 [Bienertia sinuspersici]